MVLTAKQVEDVIKLIEIHMVPDLEFYVRHDIEQHFKRKSSEHPEFDAVEMADIVTDYIYEKYLGTIVQAMMSSQIIAKEPVLIMRQEIIKALKA